MRKLILILMICIFSSSVHADLGNGLIGWWKFNEASGNAIDSSGQGNTGTPTGSPLVSNCKKSSCRSFNGTTDFVLVKNGTILSGLTSYSIAGWMNSTARNTNGGTVIYGERASAGNNILKLQAFEATIIPDSVGLVIRNDAGNLVRANGSVVVSDGAWHLIVATRNGTDLKIYIDGVQDGGITNWSSADNYTDANLVTTIGKDGYGAYFNGLIDDVRIYNRALTDQEVKDLFVSGVRIRNAVIRNAGINR